VKKKLREKLGKKTSGKTSGKLAKTRKTRNEKNPQKTPKHKKKMRVTKVNNDGLHFKHSIAERSHLVLATDSLATALPRLLVQEEDESGVLRTIKQLDFGAATGGTLFLDSMASVGDKILVGQQASLADGTETDAAYRTGYGVLDFHEAGEADGAAEAAQAASDPAGQAGLGHFTVSNSVYVDGETHASAFVCLSDARLKSHVGTVTDEEAALVYAIRAVTYTMMGAESAGVIAQELERVFPRAVRTRPTGVKSVDYQQVNTLLLRAVQLLERRVCVLEATK
jgi:hypothetical protein